MNPIFIILGLAAIIYVPTVIGAISLDIRVASLIPLEIHEKLIRLNVGVEYYNPTAIRLNLNRLQADVLLNGLKIGTINQNHSVPILSKRKQVISNFIELTPDNLGSQLWQEAINANLHNFVLELKGHVVVNNKRLPIHATWTIHDFINSKGVSGVGSTSTIGKMEKILHYLQAVNNDYLYIKKEAWTREEIQSYLKDVRARYTTPLFFHYEDTLKNSTTGSGDINFDSPELKSFLLYNYPFLIKEYDDNSLNAYDLFTLVYSQKLEDMYELK